jgi:carotenoid 1,2-hydratase
MQEAVAKIDTDLLNVTSSVAEDVWHRSPEPAAYEWWYFDALSSGGKDAVIIKFADNSIDSPRYGVVADNSVNRHVPAVSFTYIHDGRTTCSFVNEFASADFAADKTAAACTIAESRFSFEKAEYGTGYRIEIHGKSANGKTIEASFEWLLIESDILAGETPNHNGHCWNIISPRADVTGQITVHGRNHSRPETYKFRGSGYHDHNRDDRNFLEHVSRWVRGRVHYADSTAIFCSYGEFGSDVEDSRLLIVRDGQTRERKVSFDVQEWERGRFGTSYPSRIRLVTDENIRLRIKPETVIDSSRFCQRFFSEMTLTLRDGIPRKANGIVEFISPKVSRFRLLNWLNNRLSRPPR